MYSLLVSHQLAEQTEGTFVISRDRFLEYTGEIIAEQLQSLSNEAIDCIKAWPCLLMQEGRGEERAYVGRIIAVHDVGTTIKLTITPCPSALPILNDTIWRIRGDLDIEQFEFSRNHWAFKERDLFHTLSAAGHVFDASQIALFSDRPLPAPRRADLIAARNELSGWSHTEIDDFLLEVGVKDMAAGREIGSRRDRANAIVEFALAHPAAKTAENSMLSAFISREVGLPTISSDVDTQSAAIPEPSALVQSATAPSGRSPNGVFIVHGQNDAARSEVVSFLSSVGLSGIVLHEQPNMGRHLLTKFIDEAELVTFAIVLMTDDDMGSRKGQQPAPRARQNVILELGYFLSHLGQARVCALITPGLETPSDFDGIVYIRMDDAGRWKVELKRELAAARMPLTEFLDN